MVARIRKYVALGWLPHFLASGLEQVGQGRRELGEAERKTGGNGGLRPGGSGAVGGASWGKRNEKPAATAACGRARWLASSTCDISPKRARRAKAGTGKMAGRCTAAASARVNSALITGLGATPFSGPLTGD